MFNRFHNFCLPEAYVITLAETCARKWAALQHLNKECGFNVKPYYGFNGKKMGLTSTQQSLTQGMIGCMLGHMSLWKMLEASDKDEFLIFEDDVLLPPDALATMSKAYTLALPSNWRMVYWGYCWRDTASLKSVNRSFDLAGVPPMCQHAYMIKKGTASKLLAELDCSQPMDVQTRELLQRLGGVYVYTDPMFARQRSLVYTDCCDGKVPVVAEDNGLFSSQTCHRNTC